jgi:hypothetical protein
MIGKIDNERKRKRYMTKAERTTYTMDCRACRYARVAPPRGEVRCTQGQWNTIYASVAGFSMFEQRAAEGCQFYDDMRTL